MDKNKTITINMDEFSDTAAKVMHEVSEGFEDDSLKMMLVLAFTAYTANLMEKLFDKKEEEHEEE